MGCGYWQTAREAAQGHIELVWAVEFSSEDGNLLASASDDGTVRLWNIEEESLITEACTTTNRDLSQDEWSRSGRKEFDYVRTCSGLPTGYGVEEHVIDQFEAGFRFEVGQEWEFAAPETTDQVWVQTSPKAGQLLFTNPRHVFDPTNLSKPKEIPPPESPEVWVSWLQKHPNLETSKPLPVSVGGASGKLIDVRASSTPENYPRKICYGQPYVPFYPISDGSTIVSYEGWNDRAIIVDVGGETVLIDVSALAEKFDAFSPKAQEVLESVEWKGW